jgi:dolichyl-phosphate-mannose-protein mannosyltransferase
VSGGGAGTRGVHLIVVAAVIFGAAAIRLRLLEVPLERDEGEFAYGATLLLDRVAPFSQLYTMKLPGTPLAYALSMLLFGRSVAAIRLGLLLANAATTLLVFLLARRLMRPSAAVASACAFAALSLSPVFFGFLAHATHFVILPAVAGLLVLHRALDSRRQVSFFAAGVLLGLAVLMKQSGLVFSAFAVAWWAWERLQRPGRAGWAGEAAALGAGVMAPLAATVAGIASCGTLEPFWFWTVEYAREYATSVPLVGGLRTLAGVGASMLPVTWPLLALALSGAIAAATPRVRADGGLLILALLLFSLAGVASGLYFRRHYFILALPALSLLAGLAYQELSARASQRIAAATVALACLYPVAARAGMFFRMDGPAISRELYGDNPFTEAVEIGRWLRDRTTAGERVAVLGSEPEIFFYSGRRSATGHIYMYWLMEEQPFAARMQEQVIDEIERAQPPYVVWVLTSDSWLPQPRSLRRIFQWANVYLPGRYAVVGHAERLENGESRYLFGPQAAAAPVDEGTLAIVLERSDLAAARASAR